MELRSPSFANRSRDPSMETKGLRKSLLRARDDVDEQANAEQIMDTLAGPASINSTRKPIPLRTEEPGFPALVFMGVGLVMAAASAAVGFWLIGDSFTQPSIHPGIYGVLQWSNWFGILILITCLPLGLWSMLFGLTLWNVRRPERTHLCNRLILAFLTLCFLITLVTSAIFLIKKHYCTQRAHESPSSVTAWPVHDNDCDALLQNFGITFLLLSAGLVATFGTKFFDSDVVARRSINEIHTRDVISSPAFALWLVSLILTSMFLLSGFTPQYSIATAGESFASHKKSREYFIIRWDCLVYFAAFSVVLIAGGSINARPRMKALLSQPARILNTIALKIFGPSLCTHSVSYGEALVIFGFTGFFIFWGIYWGLEGTNRNLGGLQIAAKILGHLTSLLMAALAFPVARNNMFVSLFQMPYQSFLNYHKFLGYLTYILLTAHMLLWMIKWVIEGSLATNIFAIDYLEVSKGVYHFDNFTVVLAEIAWVLCSALIMTTVLCRRRNYEIFYYVHKVGILVYIIAIFHAWNFWYYGTTGLLLWWFDVCQRGYQQLQRYQIREFRYLPEAGITLVAIDAPNFEHKSGQFVRVNIPDISELSWKPFYVFSSPRHQRKLLVVKNLGNNTWTEKLAVLTYLLDGTRTGRASIVTESSPELYVVPSLALDGPYGGLPFLNHHDEILIAVGGTGITAFHSLISEFVFQALKMEYSIPTIHLVWTMRNPALVDLCADLLLQAMDLAPFTVSLYCSTRKYSNQGVRPATDGFSRGTSELFRHMEFGRRPDLDKFIARNAAAANPKILVCGPESLSNSCISLACRHNVSCHVEKFDL